MNLFDDDISCSFCGVGKMHRKLTTYVRMFGETLVTVPNMPTMECDVCHRRDYDAEGVQRIEGLVIPSGPPPNRYQPITPAPTPAPKRNSRSAKQAASIPTPTRTSKSKAGSKN